MPASRGAAAPTASAQTTTDDVTRAVRRRLHHPAQLGLRRQAPVRAVFGTRGPHRSLQLCRRVNATQAAFFGVNVWRLPCITAMWLCAAYPAGALPLPDDGSLPTSAALKCLSVHVNWSPPVPLLRRLPLLEIQEAEVLAVGAQQPIAAASGSSKEVTCRDASAWSKFLSCAHLHTI